MNFYRELKPAARLKDIIKCIWILESPAPAAPFPAERVLPDGCMEIVFHYGENFESSRDNKNFTVQPRTIISGQLLSSIFLRPSGSSKMIGVRFFPAGAYYFTGIPLKELTGCLLPLHSIFSTVEAGNMVNTLEERINLTQNLHHKIQLIEDYIYCRIRKNNISISTAGKAAKIVEDTAGQVKIKELGQAAGISERKLQRDFEDYVGLTPKQFARILRFQNAVKSINKNETSLTQIAHKCGYYDQAHFIKEFTEICGQKPSSYIKEKHALSDLFTS